MKVQDWTASKENSTKHKERIIYILLKLNQKKKNEEKGKLPNLYRGFTIILSNKTKKLID